MLERLGFTLGLK